MISSLLMLLFSIQTQNNTDNPILLVLQSINSTNQSFDFSVPQARFCLGNGRSIGFQSWKLTGPLPLQARKPEGRQWGGDVHGKDFLPEIWKSKCTHACATVFQFIIVDVVINKTQIHLKTLLSAFILLSQWIKELSSDSSRSGVIATEV